MGRKKGSKNKVRKFQVGDFVTPINGWSCLADNYMYEVRKVDDSSFYLNDDYGRETCIWWVNAGNFKLLTSSPKKPRSKPKETVIYDDTGHITMWVAPIFPVEEVVEKERFTATQMFVATVLAHFLGVIIGYLFF